MAMTSWLFVTFDTAGEVSFAGISTQTNPVFRLVLNVNCPHFRLCQQYHFW
jgi:hypothetical protein